MKRIVILLVLSVLSVRSEEPANNRALLDKLRADDFDERLDARAKLIARGSAVRELVTRELARTDLDADYKTNLKAVAAGLSEGVALEPFDAPKRLDFEARGETVAKALEIISQQYGQIVTARGNAGSKRVTVSIKRATFIEVVNAVRENAGLNFFPNMDIAKPKVDVVRGGTTEDFANLALCEPPEGVNGIVATSGPFAIVLNQAVMGVGIGDPVLYRNLNISGYIYYGTDVKLSKMKITALKASTSDNKQTFDLVAPNVS